jgi:hypothetical protein
MRKNLIFVSLLMAGLTAAAQDTNTIVPLADTVHIDTSIVDDIKDNILDNIPTLSLDDNDLSDVSSQNVSSLLTAGRDPFYNAATYNFSPVRFKIRGYDGDYASTYINNIPMDNLDNGFTPFGLWGGLNDVFRNRDITLGLRYNTFAFGDISSTTNIDVRASKQRRQTSIGYAYSNRTYDQRFTATYSSGINKKGWAYTVSGSRRYAGEGYVAGTYYNGWSWFAAVDKKLGQKNLLSLVAFGAPTENGRSGPAVQEMYDLAGTHYYNPYWGYQNGKKRNANIGRTDQPVIMLTHDFRIKNNTDLTTSVGYSFGERSTSGIDWYNAPDPRPDYYRYLPSYYKDDIIQFDEVTKLLQSSEAARQIKWDNLYNINRYNSATIYNADGIEGNTVSGNRSYYILGERVTDAKRLNASTTLNARLSNHIDYTGGLTYQTTKNNYFQRINDMLGGSFWVDLNQFAQRDYPGDVNAYQNDLNHPNGIKHVDDKYGYNYDIDINRAAAWSQFVFKFNHVDLYISGEGSQTKFWRVGNVKNGLFPDNSYGKSAVYTFNNYGAKGGATYKINGRNYIFVNGAYITRAPYFDNVYVSPRTRDVTQDNLKSEVVTSAEAGYILNAPKLKIHLSGYYTTIQHSLNVLSYYDDGYANYVNYALSNIDRLYFGGEFGFEAKVMPNVTVTGAASVGRYYYNSRQFAVTTLDNTAETLSSDTVYSLNYRIPSTPQEAYSLGITYRSPKFWFISVTGSYFDNMWLDFNPIRRTYSATKDLTQGSDVYNSVLGQQKLDAQYTVDVFAGYSWKLPHTYVGAAKKPVYLAFYAGVNNVLNNQDIISGGYEQLRYDKTAANINEFPAKYYYAYGLNYFFSVALRF